MQRLIAVAFGRRDEVLEAARNHRPAAVDQAERAVAFAHILDDDPEVVRADRRDVEVGQQVARVALPRARRIGDGADRAKGHAAQLLADEVLLDLLLHRDR